MTKRRQSMKRVMEDFELRVKREQELREKSILEDHFTDSPIIVGVVVCRKCFVMVERQHATKHFDWHDEQDTRFNSLKRDVEHIERNVDLPARWD